MSIDAILLIDNDPKRNLHMMANVCIAIVVLLSVALAAQEGKLKTDKLVNVSITLAVAGVVCLIIGISQFLSQHLDNATLWCTWSIGTIVCALITRAAAVWIYARFELPTKRHVAK